METFDRTEEFKVLQKRFQDLLEDCKSLGIPVVMSIMTAYDGNITHGADGLWTPDDIVDSPVSRCADIIQDWHNNHVNHLKDTPDGT